MLEGRQSVEKCLFEAHVDIFPLLSVKRNLESRRECKQRAQVFTSTFSYSSALLRHLHVEHVLGPLEHGDATLFTTSSCSKSAALLLSEYRRFFLKRHGSHVL